MIEALPTFTLIILLATSILMLSYMLFTRVWIDYQGEQALYCASEGRSPNECVRHYKEAVHEFVPWGRMYVSLSADKQKWELMSKWSLKKYHIKLGQVLAIHDVLRNKDLRWSSPSP